VIDDHRAALRKQFAYDHRQIACVTMDFDVPSQAIGAREKTWPFAASKVRQRQPQQVQPHADYARIGK